MTDHPKNRLLRPETLTALIISVIAIGFLFPTSKLRAISALLPAAMLIGLIVLGVVLLVIDQHKASRGETAAAMTKAPKRVAGAFLLILGYALATDFVGFYVSTRNYHSTCGFCFRLSQPAGPCDCDCHRCRRNLDDL